MDCALHFNSCSFGPIESSNVCSSEHIDTGDAACGDVVLLSSFTSPYGTWQSRISPDDFAAGSTIFEGVQVDVSILRFGRKSLTCIQKSGKIYLGDIRPHEGGRGAIIQASSDGTTKDVLPSEYSALSQVEARSTSMVTRALQLAILMVTWSSQT